MQKVTLFSFTQLRNSEHVAFFHNVALALDKVGAETIELPVPQLSAYKQAVDAEQDVVNRPTASVYTPEMKEMDDERDRIFRAIRLKLQAATYASKESDLAEYANVISVNLLSKYGIEVVSAAYQAESALLRGFILDAREILPPSALEAIGISDDIDDLERVNDRFSDQYNERVTEKSQTNTDLARKLRDITEEQYRLLVLHLEFKANSDTTEVGTSCTSFIAVINQLIKDAKRVLNLRLGKPADDDDVESEENMEG